MSESRAVSTQKHWQVFKALLTLAAEKQHVTRDEAMLQWMDYDLLGVDSVLATSMVELAEREQWSNWAWKRDRTFRMPYFPEDVRQHNLRK